MGGLGLMNRRRAIASSPTAGKGVESLLQNLLFRYSVNEQNATNESLAANPVLVDLSGNGFDLPLSGFNFNGTNNGIMTDSDGEKYLRFGNSPACYASLNTRSLGYPMSRFAEYTMIAKRKWIEEGNYEYLLTMLGESVNYQICEVERNETRGTKVCRSIGFRTLAKIDIGAFYNKEKSVIYQCNDSYNGVAELLTDGSFLGNFSSLQIGNSVNKGVFDLYDMLFFDKRLTDSEIGDIVKHFKL